jgi:hypothetical protein
VIGRRLKALAGRYALRRILGAMQVNAGFLAVALAIIFVLWLI